MREGERPKPPLTLEGLFERKLLRRRNSSFKNDDGECELSLKIQGERGMPAIFMHCICLCLPQSLALTCLQRIKHRKDFSGRQKTGKCRR